MSWRSSARRARALLTMLLASSGCAPEVVIGYAPVPQLRDAGTDGDAEEPLPEITWLSGAHPGNDLPDYLEFGDWRGRPLDFAHVFPDRGSWQGLINPSWPFDMFEPFEGRMMMSVPPYPPGAGLTAQQCADGDFDDEWAQLGTFLRERGRGDTVIRLGWGPNDTDHEWAVAAGATPEEIDVADRDAWVRCFQNVVGAIRSTAPDVEIDWTINPIGPPLIARYDPFLTYPGDAYVDYVGIELFDMYPPAQTDAEWDAICNGPTGLCTLAAFARAHGKRLGIAEWGVASCAGDGEPDSTGVVGGDNPFFIQKVVETFADNADIMAYDVYFEDGNLDLCSNIFSGGGVMNEQSAAKYRELFAPR